MNYFKFETLLIRNETKTNFETKTHEYHQGLYNSKINEQKDKVRITFSTGNSTAT